MAHRGTDPVMALAALLPAQQCLHQRPLSNCSGREEELMEGSRCESEKERLKPILREPTLPMGEESRLATFRKNG